MKRLLEVKKMTSMPIISVGGIMDADEAIARIRSGAVAIQIYTGWIYGGPFFARKLARLISGLK